MIKTAAAVFGLTFGTAGLAAGCDNKPHTTCTETNGWISCTTDGTSTVVVQFPAHLTCPEEDSCDLSYENDGWTITPAAGS